MIAIAVWYDPDCDQIWITGEARSYARRSLVAFINGPSGDVGIRLKAADPANAIIMTPYTNLTDQAGMGFLSAVEAKAYLDFVFSERRSSDIPSATAVAAEDIPAGYPVAVSRLDGTLRIARADTYTLAFVAGLAPEPIASGFAGTVTRNALTLPDWTAVTGTASLSVGQPYFLTAEGGLSTTPVMLPGQCSVRVGNATGPQTLAPIQADPILL